MSEHPPRGTSNVLRIIVLAAVFLVLPATALILLKAPRQLSADLSKLLPTEQPGTDPEAAAARRQIQEHLTRALLIALDDTLPTAPNRRRVAESLTPYRDLGRISGFWIAGSNPWEPIMANDFPGENAHWSLLLPAWLQEHAPDSLDRDTITRLARETAGRLDAYLDDPMATASPAWLAQDPLLLLPGFMDRSQNQPSASHSPASPGAMLIWVSVDADPFIPEGQAQLTSLSDELRSSLQKAFPGATPNIQGVHLPAIASEHSIRQEVFLLNTAAFMIMLIILTLAFRRLRYIAALFVPILAGALWACLLTLIFFGEIHLIALALGSVLFGVGIDYGLHLLTHAVTTHYGLATAFKQLRRPLLIGAGSSMLGFAFLALAPMDGLRQVALLIPVGIVTTLLACRYLMPALVKPGTALTPTLAWIAHIGSSPSNAACHFLRIIILILALAGLLLLATFPRFNDSLDNLQPPPGQALTDYESMRLRFTGESRDSEIRMTFAPSAELLWDKLSQTQSISYNPPLAGLLTSPAQVPALASFVRQRDDFRQALETALAADGWEPGDFAPAWQALNQLHELSSTAAFEQNLFHLASQLTGPQALLLFETGHGLATVYAADPEDDVQPLPPGTLRLGEATRLHHIMQAVRQTIIRCLLAALAILTLVLILSLGWRRGLYISLLPLLALSFPLGLVAWHSGISLLALLGAILAYCLALDYAALASESTSPVLSVRLSALTTAAVFGLLTLSSIPALRDFGTVVALTVVLAALTTEFLPRSHALKKAIKS